MLGEVSRKAAEVLNNDEVFEFFLNCMLRSIPRGRTHAAGELRGVRTFLANFSGDNVRFLA
jgi:hypothetical protein